MNAVLYEQPVSNTNLSVTQIPVLIQIVIAVKTAEEVQINVTSFFYEWHSDQGKPEFLTLWW